jgi:hypothetical protein
MGLYRSLSEGFQSVTIVLNSIFSVIDHLVMSFSQFIWGLKSQIALSNGPNGARRVASNSNNGRSNRPGEKWDRLVHPMTRITFKGDSRTYRREKSTEHSRYHVYCDETEAHEDGIWKCSFLRQGDEFKRNMTHYQTHECKFKAPPSPFQKQVRLASLAIVSPRTNF